MTSVRERTLALVAPVPPLIGDDFRVGVRTDLVARLGALVAPLSPGDPVVVGLPLLRRARTRPETLAEPEEPFAWRPVFVRRSLGLAVVDACARGRFRTPLEAVEPVVAEAVAGWEETGWRTYHWEPWMARLAPGARAVVLAEAVGWASSLWSSFDWAAFDQLPQFGGTEDQWVCPAVRTLRLKARSELRVPLGGQRDANGAGADATTVGLVSVSGGSPPAAWRDELAYLALVAALRSPSRPVPARVLGLWPDAGADHCVEIDEGTLSGAAERVVATVAAVVDARRRPIAA
jgi:hypothetical protein